MSCHTKILKTTVFSDVAIALMMEAVKTSENSVNFTRLRVQDSRRQSSSYSTPWKASLPTILFQLFCFLVGGIYYRKTALPFRFTIKPPRPNSLPGGEMRAGCYRDMWLPAARPTLLILHSQSFLSAGFLLFSVWCRIRLVKEVFERMKEEAVMAYCKVLPSIRLTRQRKITKARSQDSRPVGQNFKLGFSEREAGVLTFLPHFR
jgi:hypothetical protein